MPVRSTVAVLATLSTVALGLGASPPAQAARPVKIPAVTSGNARFEVLSPTLIRTEYAAGGHFTDAGTFNVVGRGGFSPAHFTKKIDKGWLTIDTGAATLRYKVGSGPFAADNLSVRLKAGRQQVEAAPWA